MNTITFCPKQQERSFNRSTYFMMMMKWWQLYLLLPFPLSFHCLFKLIQFFLSLMIFNNEFIFHWLIPCFYHLNYNIFSRKNLFLVHIKDKFNYQFSKSNHKIEWIMITNQYFVIQNAYVKNKKMCIWNCLVNNKTRLTHSQCKLSFF